VIELAFLENFVERGEHGEIAATRTPGGVIGSDGFFGELFPRRCSGGCVSRNRCGCFAHKNLIRKPGTQEKRNFLDAKFRSNSYFPAFLIH
jgi:hypothetical protein